MDNVFIWSDNWWIENNNAWFVDGKYNALFQVNMNTEECEFLMEVPNNTNNRFRSNSRCMKVDREIYCFPDMGQSIWVYHLDEQHFYEIKIDNPERKRLGVEKIWKLDNEIWFVSTGLKQILELDLYTKHIKGSYLITDKENEKIATSIIVGNNIYSVSDTVNKIYQFNIKEKVKSEIVIQNIETGFNTICFDGDKFWLSGFRKEIYIWKKGKNVVNVLNHFPADFGIYKYGEKEDCFVDFNSNFYNKPTFYDSFVVGMKVWFIPFQTNKIIYIDKVKMELAEFIIEDEEETKESLVLREMQHKFLVQYILDNRYIGIFSLKNSSIINIDTRDMKTSKKKYFFSNKCLEKIIILCKKRGVILKENCPVDKLIYKIAIKKNLC